MTMSSTPRRSLVSSIQLAAVVTAVSQSREFIRQTLADWQLADQVDSAELLVSELVTNAVKSTGTAEVAPEWEGMKVPSIIGVQLRLVEPGLYVEVWDSGDGSPVIPEQSLDAEGGRGLFLVESLSARWDIYRPVVGGKIVWAELSLGKSAGATTAGGELPQHEQGRRGPAADRGLAVVDAALVERVLSGLQHLLKLGLAG